MWTWRSCIRFTIREYALVVTIVGLAVVWRLDHDRLSRGFRYTGQPLDVAIQGKGFFTLIDEATALMVHTRSGKFSVNDQGVLIARLDGKDWPILPSIQIPNDATAITISTDRRVSVLQPGNPELLAMGQLQLADFDDPTKLKRVSPSVYIQTEASGPQLLCRPGDQGFGIVLQGVLNNRSDAQKFSCGPWQR
jgi:flagellar basal-body rod protein FlgG